MNNKTKNITTFEEHLTENYGELGTEQRTEFESKAKAFVKDELRKRECYNPESQ